MAKRSSRVILFPSSESAASRAKDTATAFREAEKARASVKEIIKARNSRTQAGDHEAAERIEGILNLLSVFLTNIRS